MRLYSVGYADGSRDYFATATDATDRYHTVGQRQAVEMAKHITMSNLTPTNLVLAILNGGGWCQEEKILATRITPPADDSTA